MACTGVVGGAFLKLAHRWPQPGDACRYPYRLTDIFQNSTAILIDLKTPAY